MTRTRPRLCRYYCNARSAAGLPGPLCPHCDACERAVRLWSTVLGADYLNGADMRDTEHKT